MSIVWLDRDFYSVAVALCFFRRSATRFVTTDFMLSARYKISCERGAVFPLFRSGLSGP